MKPKHFPIVEGVCSQCGMAGKHFTHTECIDALRSMLGDLEMAMVGMMHRLSYSERGHRKAGHALEAPPVGSSLMQMHLL